MKEDKKITKNVYQKLQECRVALQKANLKKSGSNKFAGFKYYELADFLPKINELFNENGLFSKFNIVENIASLEIINAEAIEESIIFTSPTAEANLKGCTPIQSLGGIHTYMKRYLYLNALEIVENDMFDSKVDEDEKKEQLNLLVRFNELITLTKTDKEKMYEYFKVKNNSEMSKAQFEEAIVIMEKKMEA